MEVYIEPKVVYSVSVNCKRICYILRPVWSCNGPVPDVGVGPELMTQSVLLWAWSIHLHVSFWSKLQSATARAEGDEGM